MRVGPRIGQPPSVKVSEIPGARDRDVQDPKLKIGVRVRGSANKMPGVDGVFLSKIKMVVAGEHHVYGCCCIVQY